MVCAVTRPRKKIHCPSSAPKPYRTWRRWGGDDPKSSWSIDPVSGQFHPSDSQVERQTPKASPWALRGFGPRTSLDAERADGAREHTGKSHWAPFRARTNVAQMPAFTNNFHAGCGRVTDAPPTKRRQRPGASQTQTKTGSRPPPRSKEQGTRFRGAGNFFRQAGNFLDERAALGPSTSGTARSRRSPARPADPRARRGPMRRRQCARVSGWRRALGGDRPDVTANRPGGRPTPKENRRESRANSRGAGAGVKRRLRSQEQGICVQRAGKYFWRTGRRTRKNRRLENADGDESCERLRQAGPRRTDHGGSRRVSLRSGSAPPTSNARRPPRALGFRLIDREGREILGRDRG